MPATPQARAVFELAKRLNALNAELKAATDQARLEELRKQRQALRADYIDTHALYVVDAFRDDQE